MDWPQASVRRSPPETWNRWLAVIPGVIAISAFVLRLRLWRYDLRIPLVYWGDALYQTVMVKGLTEGILNYHISRLGAPFGMDAVDFPIGCSLDFAIIKLLSFATSHPGLLLNLYWILSVGLAASFASLLLRSLGIGFIWATAFGVLYAIIPWVVYQNVA